MRTQHQLWRVSNGWLLVPEGNDGQIKSDDASKIVVFRTLKEFADEYPKRERKRRTTKNTTTKEYLTEPTKSS